MQCREQSLLQDLEEFYDFYEQSMKSQQFDMPPIISTRIRLVV